MAVKLKNVKKSVSCKSKKKLSKNSKKVSLKEPKPLSKAKTLSLLERPDFKEFILKLAGEDGLKVLLFLVNHFKEIDEFTLADKVNLQINYVRSLLYKLYEEKLVAFSRERDKQKGWFIYSWVVCPERIKYILIRQKEKAIINLENQMHTCEDNFKCGSCGKTFNYIEAMENMFFCPFCGDKLKSVDCSELKAKINSQIKALEDEIKLINKI